MQSSSRTYRTASKTCSMADGARRVGQDDPERYAAREGDLAQEYVDRR